MTPTGRRRRETVRLQAAELFEQHRHLPPNRGVHIDQLIGATAAGEYVALYLPAQRSRRRPSHMWVTTKDREQYLDATGEPRPRPQPGKVDDIEPGASENLPLNHECSYEQRLQAKRRRASPHCGRLRRLSEWAQRRHVRRRAPWRGLRGTGGRLRPVLR
ncbi:hypothetical protein GCM10020254_83560 [Streptomyces goshikiensis]